jgi:hypothetical protein
MTLNVESRSFGDGKRIPEQYAFGVPKDGKAAPEGGNVSPHLRWDGAPEATRSFAVVCIDEDVPSEQQRMNKDGESIEETAPREPLAHWLVVDVPPEVHEIPEGAASDRIVPHGKPVGETAFGGRTGANGYTQFFSGDDDMEGTYGGYDGPFPPWNDERTHRYHFRVYALDAPSLDLSPEFGLDELARALEGHVIDQGELVGSYSTKADGA